MTNFHLIEVVGRATLAPKGSMGHLYNGIIGLQSGLRLRFVLRLIVS